MSTKLRHIPSSDLLLWRARFLSDLRNLSPVRPDDISSIGLSPGNSKTGKTGKFFRSIFVWNLPAVITCPGASTWCLQHCYNADVRENVFPIKTWAQNWWVVINEPERLLDTILKQLALAERPCAVRLHSSGDFFSEEYIELWIRLIATATDTKFWGYTRSWIKPDLQPSLNRLKSLENMELFASWDASMGEKQPEGDWRRAFVYTDLSLADAHYRANRKALICPEQIGRVPNCASCGFCIRHINKDVLFYFH